MKSTTNELADPDPGELMDDLIGEIQFQINPMNRTAHVSYLPTSLKLVGLGTDAIVIRHKLHNPNLAYKVFAHETLEKLEAEFTVYQLLHKSPIFARCFAKGKNI